MTKFLKINELWKSKPIFWVYTISIIYIIVNAYFLANENLFFSLLPFALLIVMLAFLAYDKLYLLLIFFVPLSIPLKYLSKGLTFDMSLPTEPILAGLLILFMLKFLFERDFDRRILSHPISLAIYFNLFWILITAITSSMPVVSFKFFIARCWFIVAFYFIATQVFRNLNHIKRFLWLYIFAFSIVICYTIIRHAFAGLLDYKAVNYAVKPFYSDHTSYGAILAMYIPILFGFAFSSKIKWNLKIFIWLFILLFLVATVLSYTRAAWVSLAGAFVVFLILKLKIKLRYIIILGVSSLVLFFAFQDQIMMSLKKNRTDSSTDIKKHLESISNVSTDASNLERINRWNSAFRMFKQRPVFGWGPGTYQFKYAPFQREEDKTIITTNAGDMGNAHSEYIGPLAESGVLGSISFVIIIAVTLVSSIRVYKRLKDRELRGLTISMLMALITYYLHGFLNNFLDTDKASAPFWGFMAAIVAFDIYYKDNEEDKPVIVENEIN